MANNFQPIGSELQINSGLTLDDQRDPDIAALTDGRFFVAYMHRVSGGDFDIYGQFVNGDGTLFGAKIAINTDGLDNNGGLQTLPAVAPRLDGGVAVFYNDNDLNGSASFDISLNVVSPTGVVGPLLTAADFGAFQLLNPDAATLANGQVVFTFEHVFSGTDRDIWLRVLNADGTTFASPASVAVDDSLNTVRQRPAIAASGNNALVAYEDAGSDDIFAKLYDGNAGTVGPLITVATAGTLDGADVAALADGRYIVTWDDDDTDDIQGRFVSANGVALGAAFTISNAGGDNDDARVAALPDGGFIVTWDNNGGVFAPEDGSDRAVLARRFDANGEPAGDLFLVNMGDPSTNQLNPAVAVTSAGRALLAWEDDHAYAGPGEDPDPTGVRGHVFQAATDVVYGTNGKDTITTYSLSEQIYGLRGKDTIDARAGDDLVDGGKGRDVLTGGLGLNSILFDARPKGKNLDHVTDFTPGADTIVLDRSVFKKLKLGELKEKAFFSQDGAHHAEDSSDRIIYNTETGKLRWDKDGEGGHKAKPFAVLDGSPDNLGHDDFLIVA